MHFYKILFLSCLVLFSGSARAAYENANGIVEEIARAEGIVLSPLVLPSGAKRAQNISENLKHASSDTKCSADLSLMPHTRRLGDMHFLFIPAFPQSAEEVLQSYFFPNTEYLTPNTMPKNDPISNLNRARLKKPDEQQNASVTLGKLVRVIHDALQGHDHVENISDRLLTVWGISDPKKIKVFKDIDEATFQRQEMMRAFMKGAEMMRGHLEQLEEAGEEEEDDNPSEQFKIIKDAWKKENELTLWAQQFFPDFFKHRHLEEGMLETWQHENAAGQHKIQEENLKRLRKRQIAQLMAQGIHQERIAGKSLEDSSLLSLIMTFVWKTSGPDALQPFYEGFLGKDFRLKAEDEEKFMGLVKRDALEGLLDETIKNPASFWHRTETEKFALLNLEESNRLFRFPVLGSAVLPTGQDFADCMELALRKKFYHLLKDPKTGVIRYDLLPEGPFQDYFKEYGEEDKRLSQNARNDWGVLMTRIPGAQFRKDGYELDPSIENYISVLQAVMGNDEVIVTPLAEDVDKASLFEKYEGFLQKASEWFSAQLKRTVRFQGDGDWYTVLEAGRWKTLGLVDIKIATFQKPLEEGGAEAWEMPAYGVSYINMMGGTSDAHAEYNLMDKPGDAAGHTPLADQVWDTAESLKQKESLLPWMTPSLMTKIDGLKDDEFKDALLKRWLQLNLVDYPSIYPMVIKWAMEQKVLNPYFMRPGLLSEQRSREDIVLILHRLLQNPETAPLVSDVVLDQLVFAAPDFLDMQAPRDFSSPADDWKRVKSMLELMVERERWDVLRTVSPKVKELMFELNSSDIFTAPFWQNLDKAAEALSGVKNILFINIDDALKPENSEAVVEILRKISLFKACTVSFSTLTPEILETFLPVIKEDNVKNINYRCAQGSEFSPEAQAEPELQLQEKFAELQAAGKIGAEVVLKQGMN